MQLLSVAIKTSWCNRCPVFLNGLVDEASGGGGE